MKVNPYFFLGILSIWCLGCSKDNESVIAPGDLLNSVVETYDPVSIKFVYEDGSAVQTADCLSPDAIYAIEIEATKNNSGNTKISIIEYTINGVLYSMSFSEAGIKRNPIVLADGKNIAELVSTANNTEITYVVQDDFELVE